MHKEYFLDLGRMDLSQACWSYRKWDSSRSASLASIFSVSETGVTLKSFMMGRVKDA